MQLEFAGALPPADGRYLVRSGDTGEEESVLVLRTSEAEPAAPRRRRRTKAGKGTGATPLPLSRVTAIRAFEPFAGVDEAARWLDAVCEAEDTVEVLVDEAVALLNRALHAQGVAAADPSSAEVSPAQAARVLIGYGSGEETAAGRFTDARRVDPGTGPGSRRRQRQEELRPQERVAAVLRGRERLDTCETLLLRARADLDAGRRRESALQLRIGLEALLIELKGALTDPGHEEDMATLQQRKSEVAQAANAALHGELNEQQADSVRELLELAERVLRRRRILRG